MENKMAFTEKQIKIARTKKGSPCLWESFITFKDLTRATIIVDESGKAKNSIFLRKNNDKQSLVPIKEGDFIIKIFKDKDGVSKSIFKIVTISNMSNQADTKLVYRKSPNEDTFNDVDMGRFDGAVELAERKMNDKEFIVSNLE